ncbi:MAG: tRNA pseudouridine(38-40) synthase TruA [Spirochaetia bacterium]|nr:tRNA pseudouridine(38-40) synthase TruA [Spirochaetia bacterium]
MMSLHNIRLTLAYDGTSYCGWQVQNQDDTVQGRIENALSRLHGGQAVRITGAGRTDAGVHAAGQCANFMTDMNIPPEKFRDAINAFLPKDIRILDSQLVPDGFHARFDAKERIYKYYILEGQHVFPWQERYCLSVKKVLSLDVLNSLVSPLAGVHNFASFSAVMEDGYPMERDVRSAVFYRSGEFLVFKISADGFLRKMVRSIVGTVLELYNDGGDASDMRRILEAESRVSAGPCAPAKGLFLHQVIY